MAPKNPVVLKTTTPFYVNLTPEGITITTKIIEAKLYDNQQTDVLKTMIKEELGADVIAVPKY